MKPTVFEKYNEIAKKYDANSKDEDADYLEDPEYGDTPSGVVDDHFYITDASDFEEGFEFELKEQDRRGEIIATYYIPLTNEEITDAFIGLDANKYNL